MSVGRTLTLTAVALGAGSLLAFGQATDAPQVLAAAREALGGEKNLIAVKTFVATGRTRQLCGNNLVPIEFEINCELPDRFVRKDEIPAQDTDVTVSGFTGDTLIQFPPPGPGRAGLCVWTNRRAAARRRRVWRRRVRASAHVRSGNRPLPPAAVRERAKPHERAQLRRLQRNHDLAVFRSTNRGKRDAKN